MKIFKFFKGLSKFYGSSVFNNDYTRSRRYFGIEKGQINWIDQPVGIIYYLEPTMGVDPISNFDEHIPTVSLNMMSRTISVSTMHIYSLDTFMELNRNNYVVMYEVRDYNDNIYRRENEHEIPTNDPITLRCYVIED
jgi:hypothetical protein